MSDETAQVTTTADQTIAETVDTPSTHVPAVGGINDQDQAKDQTIGRKVFIGNLAYATTEDEVKQFISTAQGNALEINLPTRFNNKPAGYAFVLYETEEQANNAVEKLNSQVLHERQISVAIAKPPAPKKPRNKRGSSKAVTTGTAETGTAAADEHAVTEGEATDGQTAKSKKKKTKRPARRLPEEGEDAESHIPAEHADTTAAQVTDGVAKKPKAKRNRKPKNAQNGEHAAEGNAAEARIDDESKSEQAAKPKSARAPRQKTTLGEPSKTLLFVANLPFSVDDAALTEAFTSLSITPKSSKIITKPSYHYVDGKRERGPRRSKGFAFVEVENEQAQQQAIEKLQGFKMGDREITIKVANERMHQAEEQGDESALKQEGEKQAVIEEQKQDA